MHSRRLIAPSNSFSPKTFRALVSLHTTSTSSALYSLRSEFTATSYTHACALFTPWRRLAASLLLHSDSRFTVSPREANIQNRPNQSLEPTAGRRTEKLKDDLCRMK